jgi:hypothetical protein
MNVDPIQAANIIYGVWQVLHGAEAPETDRTAPVGEGRPTRIDRDFAALQERTDRLVLVVHAMWTVLTEKMGISDADLVKRITALDAADGVEDGRVTVPPVRCSCGAMVCRKLGRCLFCGKPYAAGSTFDTL